MRGTGVLQSNQRVIPFGECSIWSEHTKKNVRVCVSAYSQNSEQLDDLDMGDTGGIHNEGSDGVTRDLCLQNKKSQ